MTTTTPDSSGGVSSQVFGLIPSENGGEMTIPAESPMKCPGPMQSTTQGAMFGNVELIAGSESSTTVSGLSFLESPGILESLLATTGAGAAAVGGVAATAEGQDATVNRRRFLQASVVAGAVAFGVGSADAESNITRARFSVDENPGGLRVRLHERIASYPAAIDEQHLYVNGVEYGAFADEPKADVLPGLTGTVTVGPSDVLGGLLASFTESRTKVYDGLKPAPDIADSETGDKITITDNPMIASHTRQAAPSAVTLTVGGESIPHKSESDSERGQFSVSDGRVVYVLGSNPPSGDTATLSVYAGRVAEVLDDARRAV